MKVTAHLTAIVIWTSPAFAGQTIDILRTGTADFALDGRERKIGLS